MPVSYTHLDVYKRQVLNTINRKSNFKFLCEIIFQFVCTQNHPECEHGCYTLIFITNEIRNPENVLCPESKRLIKIVMYKKLLSNTLCHK